MFRIGRDYIETFLTSHHRFDYAMETIIYPRRKWVREYRDDDISKRYCRRGFAPGKKIKLKPCRHTLLEYHLNKSSKNMVNGFPEVEIETYNEYRDGGLREKVRGSKWILVSYPEDSFVDFIQVDIDRHHPKQDGSAKECVTKLIDASEKYRFDIVWTTSPGYMGEDGKIVHGLYAWIRLDEHDFVMDLRGRIQSFLYSIHLSEIADKHEASFLKTKRLIRLPGQFNVELADPLTFEKRFNQTPVEALRAFEDEWKKAIPLNSKVLTSLPLTPPRVNWESSTHSSVTLPPLPPQDNTLLKLQKWGRSIINKYYPDMTKMDLCLAELIATADKKLPVTSKTRQDSSLLHSKAQSIIDYLWFHTDKNIRCKSASQEEDAERFLPHKNYLINNRDELLAMVPSRLRIAAGKILDLLIKHDGRVAAVAIYHEKGNRICAYRNWKEIQKCWGLTTLVNYEKSGEHQKGSCKQWGIGSLVNLGTENQCVQPDEGQTELNDSVYAQLEATIDSIICEAAA